MMRWLGLMAGVALIAGCGSSKHATTATVPQPAKQPAPTPTATTSTPSPTTGATGAAPPPSVLVPAIFKIGTGDRLSPSTVTAPAHLTIMLIVISGDGKAHRFVLFAPSRMTGLAVPAGGRASVAVRGLPKGRYPLILDGTPRGALIIGGQPGP
jgi:hypothetical protein